MKFKIIYFLLVSAFIVPPLYGQIVVTTNVINVPCCNNIDSLDYNSDGNYDVAISSDYGIDNVYYNSSGIGNVEVTYIYDSAQVFTFYNSSGGITGTTLGCGSWYWAPGTNTFKYIGFRDLSIVNDTIFGWIKVGFNGVQNTCNDTIVTSAVVYSQTPNVHLAAGQTMITGIDERDLSNLSIYPNPASTYFTIKGYNKPYNLTIYNALGQILYTEDTVINKSKRVDVSRYSNGLIFIRIESDGEVIHYKLLKE